MSTDRLLQEISFIKAPTLLSYADRKRLDQGMTVEVIDEMFDQARKQFKRQMLFSSLPMIIVLVSVLVLMLWNLRSDSLDRDFFAIFLPVILVAPMVQGRMAMDAMQLNLSRDEILYTVWKSQQPVQSDKSDEVDGELASE